MSPKLVQWNDRRSNPERETRRVRAAVGALLVVGTVAGVVLATRPAKPAKKSKPKRTDCPGAEGGVLEGVSYQEIVTGGAEPNSKLPMVIAFHGLGAAPKLMRPIVEGLEVPARVIIPRGIEPRGANYAWWQEKSVGDQKVLATSMDKAASEVAPFLKAIVECRPTQGRPIVAGQSQGGMMVLALAATHRKLIDRGVAASAWLPIGLWRDGVAPVLLLHGSEDTTVPFVRTKDMVEELTSRGAPWDFEVVDGHGHGFGGALKNAWLAAVENAILQRS